MVKYEYDADIEAFKRVDKRGRPLFLNITEARRVENMLKMGCSVPRIYSKIDFSTDISITTLRTFIRNLSEGNISLEGDYPAPVGIVKEIDLETKYEKLAERVEHLEDRLAEMSALSSEDKKPFWRIWR